MVHLPSLSHTIYADHGISMRLLVALVRKRSSNLLVEGKGDKLCIERVRADNDSEPLSTAPSGSVVEGSRSAATKAHQAYPAPSLSSVSHESCRQPRGREPHQPWCISCSFSHRSFSYGAHVGCHSRGTCCALGAARTILVG